MSLLPRIGATVGGALLLLAPAVAAGQSRQVPAEIRYPANDSVAVIADVHRGSSGDGGPTILLFHQGGGSARGEYRSIAPRLVDSGYNVIAADIRGGGDKFGLPNRLGPAAPTFHYCEALAEVEATVNLARAQGLVGPLVLWGSSYTATLALQVAARRSAHVRAVLAFSPALGEPMQGCEPEPYVGWLARAGVPTLVIRPRREIEDRGRAESLEAMRRDGAEVFVADVAAHGSSILDAERTGSSTEPQWRAISDFIRRALEPRAASPEERAVAIPNDGWTLRGDLRPPPKTPGPLVILLHKAAGDRHIFRGLAGRLAAAGIGSLRVDLRGHGASVDRGRFIPGPAALSLKETDRDVAAIWRFVRSQPGVDTTRLAIVSGSYSSQAAAVAAMRVGYGRAHVALSPGDFSDESFRATTRGGAWLFVRSDRERFVGSWLDEKIRELAPSAELWVVPAGAAHATDLLVADSALAGRLTEWRARHLAGGTS